MGKGTGLYGNFRKKVGNTVGYTLKNSNNAQTQGVRIYQPIVSNPKTDPQSAQRMRLMPLQIFYQAFGDVLDHAFEGRKVGQMNRQRFMQLNMGVNSGLAPAVQKGERILAPIKCQVSSGSLTIQSDLAKFSANELVTTSIHYDGGENNDTLLDFTIGEVSTKLIANNLGLEEGMEVAFLFIVSRDSDPRGGVPLKFYFVLNKADNVTTIRDVMGGLDQFVDVESSNTGAIILSSEIGDIRLLGAAIIISKKRAGGWSNNNARFYPTALGEQLFYDPMLYTRALATYGPNGSTLSSDLFLRQADNDTSATSPNAVVGTEQVAIEVNDDLTNPVLSTANATVATLRSGVRAVVVNAAGKMVNADGEVIEVTFGETDNRITIALEPAATQFDGLRTVVYGSF